MFGLHFNSTFNSISSSLCASVLREDFRESPQPVTVAAGETATFRCKPPRGLPLPKVLWRHNGSPLTPTGRITIADSGDLVVVAVDRTDMGRYTCLALNKAGERESAPASLTVLGQYGYAGSVRLCWVSKTVLGQ